MMNELAEVHCFSYPSLLDVTFPHFNLVFVSICRENSFFDIYVLTVTIVIIMGTIVSRLVGVLMTLQACALSAQ